MISVPVWVGMGHYGAQSREDLARWMSKGPDRSWLIVGIVIRAVVISVLKNKKKAKKEAEEAKSKSCLSPAFSPSQRVRGRRYIFRISTERDCSSGQESVPDWL